MATTIATLVPDPQSFLTRTFQGRKVIRLPGGINSEIIWSFRVPQGAVAPFNLMVPFVMACGTAGTLRLEADIDATAPGAAIDGIYGAANTLTAAVPDALLATGAAQIPLVAVDGMAAGDMVQLRLRRMGSEFANDTAAGDCYIFGAELQAG